MLKAITFSIFTTLLCSLTSAKASAAPLKIGVSAPLTGDLALDGEATRNGFILARETIPSVDQYASFVFQDNRYDPKLAISAFRHLVDIEGVDAIYSWGESPLHGIAPLAEREQIPVIAMSLDPAPAVGKAFTMLSINPARDYAATLVPQLRARGLKRFAIVATEDPFIRAMVDGFRSELRNDEVLVVLNTVLPTEMDFRALNTSVKNTSFDALGVYLLPGQVSAFLRQIRGLKDSPVIFGTDCFESTEEIKLAGPIMLGSLYAQIDVPPWFHRAYRKRFESDSHVSFAYNAFIFAKTAAELAQRSDVRGRLLADAFRYARVEDGAFVAAQEDELGYWKFPLIVKRVVIHPITNTET